MGMYNCVYALILSILLLLTCPVFVFVTDISTKLHLCIFFLFRTYTRSVLKQQMFDKDRKAKDDYDEKIKESIIVTERDNMDKKQDAERFLARFERLKGYRDENKKVSACKLSVH